MDPDLARAVEASLRSYEAETSAVPPSTLSLPSSVVWCPWCCQHLRSYATGSDIPVCLGKRARMMRGRGETLGPPIRLPPLYAVLVNPGVPLETKAVFEQMGLRPGEDFGFGKHPEIGSGLSFDALLPLLKKARNDMEDAACVCAPVVGHVLSVISAARGCRLARMSGSGATCFGLFETRRAASIAARTIGRDHPGWWAKACVLR